MNTQHTNHSETNEPTAQDVRNALGSLPPVDIGRKLATAKSLIEDCNTTIFELRHSLTIYFDPPPNDKAVLTQEHRMYLELLIGRLSTEINAVDSLCVSIRGQKTNWPCTPEEVISGGVNAQNWYGFNTDLVGISLGRAHSVSELLQSSLSASEQSHDPVVYYDVVCAIDGNISEAEHFINMAIAELEPKSVSIDMGTQQ